MNGMSKEGMRSALDVLNARLDFEFGAAPEARDELSRLVSALGPGWYCVSDRGGAVLRKGARKYLSAPTRDGIVEEFVSAPEFGSAGSRIFGVPVWLRSSSREELRLKLEVFGE